MDKTYLSCAETAKLLRAELKVKFPKQKFSVRSDTYAGGASIRVHWTDGVALDKVDPVAKKFAGATFDGMIDLKEYHDSIYNGKTVHFGADFIFTERKISDDVNVSVAKGICKDYGVDYSDDMYSVRIGNQFLNELVWAITRTTDYGVDA